jgi:2-dehydropantoate 2-reductase
MARLPLLLSGLGLKMIVTFNAPAKAIVESHANPEELRRIRRNILDEARKLGISVPRLEAAAPLFPTDSFQSTRCPRNLAHKSGS